MAIAQILSIYCLRQAQVLSETQAFCCSIDLGTAYALLSVTRSGTLECPLHE
jgi:hypothetical protein